MSSMFNQSPSSSDSRDIYTVSRLNREVRTVLENAFPLLWIEAELSNFSRPASGHWYFSLKDEAAQVRCAMFRNKNMLVKVLPENGKQVLVRARVGLYEPRGDFQLIIEHMEEAGDGALRRQFELLKNKLAAEGLFASAHKKPIEAKFKRVGIISSSSGAAIHDVLTTLKRRFPMEKIILYPVPVQGKGASEKIASTIYKANQRKEVDVLILARGGGSLEDLWEFNEERVARAIYDSDIPIVTGIGHEVDFTIADFVADQRAATPTAAAELISPDRYQFLQKVSSLETRLQYRIQQQLQQKQQKLDWLSKRIRHPAEQLKHIQQRLDSLQQRLQTTIKNTIQQKQDHCKLLKARLQQHSPVQQFKHYRVQLENFHNRLIRAEQQNVEQCKNKLKHLAFSLDALSPLQTLQRGYAIIRDEKGNIIRDIKQVKKKQSIKSQLVNGQIISSVTEVIRD